MNFHSVLLPFLPPPTLPTLVSSSSHPCPFAPPFFFLPHFRSYYTSFPPPPLSCSHVTILLFFSSTSFSSSSTLAITAPTMSAGFCHLSMAVPSLLVRLSVPLPLLYCCLCAFFSHSGTWWRIG